VPTAPPRRLDEPLDLGGRQIFALAPALDIRATTWRQSLPVACGETRDCSQNGGRHHYGSIKQTAATRWFRRMICS
jgi:hypothetical protein